MKYLYAFKVGNNYISVLFVNNIPIIFFDPLFNSRKEYAIFYREKELPIVLEVITAAGYIAKHIKVKDIKTGEWL